MGKADQIGLNRKDVKDKARLEQNVRLAGERIFNTCLPNIMLQATVQSCNIVDCVVKIDLVTTPTSIRVTPITQWLPKHAASTEKDMHDRTKRLLGRNKSNGAITCFFRMNNKKMLAATISPRTGELWNTVQKEIPTKKKLPADWQLIAKTDPEWKEALLRELSEPLVEF